MHEQLAVRYVDDAELPPGLDWTFLSVDGVLHYIVKRSLLATSPDVILSAWIVYQSLRVPLPPPNLTIVA